MQSTEQPEEPDQPAAKAPSQELRVLRFAMAQVAAASRAAPPRTSFTRGAPESIRLRLELQHAMTGLCIARAAHRRANNGGTTPHHVELRRLATKDGDVLQLLPAEESERLAMLVLQTAKYCPHTIIEVAAAVGRAVKTGLPVSAELGRTIVRLMSTGQLIQHLESCPNHGDAHGTAVA